MPSELRERKKGDQVAKKEERSEVAERDDKKAIGSHVTSQFEMSPLFVLPLVLALMVLIFGMVTTAYEIDMEAVIRDWGQIIRGYIDNFMPKNRYQN